MLSGTNKYSGSRSKTDAWSKGVLCNSEKLTTKINVSEAGYHTVRVYNVSTGVVIDKMLLSKNNINSYFGAPESYNTTYNTTKETSTVTEDTEVSGIDKTYEPKAVAVSYTHLPLAKTENERIKKQEEKLEKAMQKYGIDDENTLEKLVSDIENISDMRDEIKEYDNKLSACNERIKMLKENIGKAEKTDIEKLKADKEETENSLEEVTEQKNSLTANILSLIHI